MNNDSNKKLNTHDGLINASLSVPFLLATGNIVPAVGALVVGALSDEIHKKEFEEKQIEWMNHPNRYIQKTQSEIQEEEKNNQDSESVIKEIMNDANLIQGNVIKGKGYNQEYIMVIMKHPGMNASYANNTECDIMFCSKVGDLNGKRVKSHCYYSASDFLARLRSDYCSGIKKYIITNSKRNEGRWMYTIDDGKSYVVCL